MTQTTSLPMMAPSYSIETRHNYTKLSADLLIVLFTFLLATQLSHRVWIGRDLLVVGGLLVGWYAASKFTPLYNDFRTLTFINEVWALLPNLLFQFAILTVFLFFLNDTNHARTFSLTYVSLLGTLITLKMYGLRKIFHYWNGKGIYQKTLVVLGDSGKMNGFVDFVKKNSQFGYKVVGVAPLPSSIKHTDELDDTFRYLEKAHSLHLLDELIVISENFEEDIAQKITQWADSKGILLRFTPRFLQFRSSRFTLELLGGKPLISVRNTLLDTDYYWLIKRLADVIISTCVLLLVGLWLVPLISLAIVLESSGPIWIKKKLLGQGGKEFDSWVFRTQVEKQKTWIGRILLQTKLDKFPRLLNVLRGDMSLVGPQAHKRSEYYQLQLATQNYKVRYRVKPGLMGWAETNEVEIQAGTDPAVLQQKVDYDIWYIENWSLLLDGEIMVKTFYKVFRSVIFK